MELLSVDDFNPPDDVETVLVKDALKGLPSVVNPNWQSEKESWRIARVCGNGYFASRLHGHIPKGVGDAVVIERLSNDRANTATYLSKTLPFCGGELKPVRKPLKSGCLSRRYHAVLAGVKRSHSLETSSV